MPNRASEKGSDGLTGQIRQPVYEDRHWGSRLACAGAVQSTEEDSDLWS